MNRSLIDKYNIPGPRYTSYPTVPFWDDAAFTAEQWQQSVVTSFNESNDAEGISIYIHLPFCESLCTYCGCNKKITTNHKVEDEYLLAIEKEWTLYRKLMKQTPVIREIHLGGGTPIQEACGFEDTVDTPPDRLAEAARQNVEPAGKAAPREHFRRIDAGFEALNVLPCRLFWGWKD